MDIMPSSPDQVKQWLATQVDHSSAISVGGYGIVAHVISQSAVRSQSQVWQDRRAMDCVSLLLIGGIRVDVPSPLPGPHPLFEACYRKMQRTVCLLLEHGADPLNTRSGPHDDLYVISQALQSFGAPEQRKNFPMVMGGLLSPSVVDRINQETATDTLFRQIVGSGSPAQVKRRVSFCIGQGVRVQDQWEDPLAEYGIRMDWARQASAHQCRAAMNEITAWPTKDMRRPMPRF